MFLHHSNTQDIMNALDEALDSSLTGTPPGIMAVFGQVGAGVTALLRNWASEHWRARHEGQKELPPIAYAAVDKSRLETLRAGAYTTPATCITFSELVYSLGEISARCGSHWAEKTWYNKPRSLISDQQFRSLYNFVRSEVRRLGISAIIVDNAHLIDGYTLRQLLNFWHSAHHQFLLILAGRIERDETLDEVLSRLVNSIEDAQREFEPYQELRRLTEEEFRRDIQEELLFQLDTIFHPALGEKIRKMRKMWWDETEGDWKLINNRHRKFARQLHGQVGDNRFITQEIFEAVMGKPLPKDPEE